MKRNKNESVKAVEDRILSIATADPNTAKEMLTQFPEFNMEAKELLDYYKITLESVRECHRAAVIGHLMTINGLYTLLGSEELTIEQKMQIIQKMQEIANEVSAISKTFADKIKDNWQEAAALAGLAIVGVYKLWSDRGKNGTKE